MELPQEIIDLIVSLVGITADSFIREHRRYKLGPEFGLTDQLATLRLVNKAFCQSATPLLFQHIKATLSSSSSRLESLQQLSLDRNASYIRQLDIGIVPSHAKLPAQVAYARDLAEMLSPCLSRLCNLRSLDILYNPEERLPPEVGRGLIDSFVSALQSVEMPHLQELEIHFPLPAHFAKFCSFTDKAPQVSMASLLQRLRHVGIRLTGRANLRVPIIHAPPEGTGWRKPNGFFAGPFANFWAYAQKLESFQADLTWDFLNQPTAYPQPLSLEYLDLNHVTLSGEALADLVSACNNSIRSLWLNGIDLSSGTWRETLLAISKQSLPKLVDFDLENCGYSLLGTSAHLYIEELRERLDYEPIESADERDLYALGHLQRRVLATRKALGLPPEGCDYREAGYPDLESGPHPAVE